MEIINGTNFMSKITNKDKLVIVDFYADWCGPCKMMDPLLKEIAAENSDLIIYKLNTDKDPDIAVKYNVSLLPTFISFKESEVHKVVEGPYQKHILLDNLR